MGSAMFCAVSLGVAATATALAIRSGKAVAHAMACIPPRLPPITAAKRSIPSRSASRAWLATQSSTVTTGNRDPYGLLVRGSRDAGPVDPKQLPRLFTPITKKRSVSTGLPGPIMLSHQPTLLGSSA
jgi:hypothetical protein